MSAPLKGKSKRKVKSFRLDELTLRKIDRYRMIESKEHDENGEPIIISESDALIKMLEKFEPKE